MKDENNRKTLVNCKNSEFLPAALQARKIVYEYYSKIDAEGIAERFRERFKDKESETGDILAFISDVIQEIFIQYPVETVKIAAIAGFMTEYEAENMDTSELFALLLECALSTRVLDFFINLARSGARNTDGIYAALILLRVISGGMTTSQPESAQNTNDTNEIASVGDMSENA